MITKTVVVLLYFILFDGAPGTKTFELPAADWENCQLDLRAIDGMNKVGETLDPTITFVGQCEVRTVK